MENERKVTEMANLARTYRNCERCSKLCESREEIVWGTGSLNAPIVFVDSHPNAAGESQHLPLGGGPKDILERMLRSEEVQIDPKDVYITTSVLCRPESRQPTRREQKNCFDRLSREIEIIDPLIVIVMGPAAAKALTSVKTKFATTAQHADAPFLEAVTKGVRGEVRRNAILTFSLRDIEEKNDGRIPIKKGGHAFWVYKSLVRARKLLDCYRNLY